VLEKDNLFTSFYYIFRHQISSIPTEQSKKKVAYSSVKPHINFWALRILWLDPLFWDGSNATPP
jgi:hypothetical protein